MQIKYWEFSNASTFDWNFLLICLCGGLLFSHFFFLSSFFFYKQYFVLWHKNTHWYKTTDVECQTRAWQEGEVEEENVSKDDWGSQSH